MTLEELFSSITADSTPILIYFVSIPLLALGTNFIAGDDEEKGTFRYMYSALIYAVSIPGIFALVILAQDVFSRNMNWRNLDVYVQILPLISMFATYTIITKKIYLSSVPGFGKLTSLLMMIAITFIAILFLEKTRFYVMFIGSLGHLLILFGVLFLVFKMSWDKFTSRR